MSKDEIQIINEWFDKNDDDRSLATYRSDTEYSVHHYDIGEFIDFCENCGARMESGAE